MSPLPAAAEAGAGQEVAEGPREPEDAEEPREARQRRRRRRLEEDAEQALPRPQAKLSRALVRPSLVS